MGNTKNRHLVFKSKDYLQLLIFLISVSCGFSQTKENKEIIAKDSNKNKLSFGYQSAFYFDPKTSIFFPFGLNTEFRLGKSNSSLDLQILLYHPKAIHDDQIGYYKFLTEYFVQYDLGMRFYLNTRNTKNTGFYVRPSVGISTKYYRTVTHDEQQNKGLEVSRLLGKEFVGIQFGFKGKISELLFANAGFGSLASFFNRDNKIFILLSPNITISFGTSF